MKKKYYVVYMVDDKFVSKEVELRFGEPVNCETFKRYFFYGLNREKCRIGELDLIAWSLIEE